MPHRTLRETKIGTEIRQERFTRGNAAPCSVCGEAFAEHERATRLKEKDGSLIRPYSRACWDCAREYLNERLRLWLANRP